MLYDIEKNKLILEGAYRKLKNYYYYNKNFIIMRDKISEFENNTEVMDNTFKALALHLSKPKSKASKTFFEDLYGKIDFYSVPKKFETINIQKENRPVSNTLSRDKKMKTVNFFVNMPIELHIIDTLWTLFIGKVADDNEIITSDVYGNTILESVINGSNTEEEINYQSGRLFNIYFYQYSEWRNRAFATLESNHKMKKDSVLISLDLQGYFYSVKFSFENLKSMCTNCELLKKIQPLTVIMENVFAVYKEIIVQYRKDMVGHSTKQYPLPIGLFSSMVLANIYLSDFDKKLKTSKLISYYGRYVDDLLFVCQKTVSPEDHNEKIINETLIQQGLLSILKDNYCISGFPDLKIQKEKIKIIYIDHKESRALIDIYNNTIRIIPSQADPIPDYDLKITSFDESAYSIEKFSKEAKLRDVGQVSIDSYKVSRFFSSLILKHSHINSFDSKNKLIQDEIFENIQQIENFFTGSQCIEYYANWMNYMYFLVITQRNMELKKFYNKAKQHIKNLKYNFLDKTLFSNPAKIKKSANDFLNQHLDVCRASALSLDVEMANEHFPGQRTEVLKYINSNMFNHTLIAFPLANYLTYDKDVSYIKMDLKEIGKYSKIDDNFKFKWSPRFIHYDELLLLLFYYNHKMNQTKRKNDFVKESVIKRFVEVNHLRYDENSMFKIGYEDEEKICFSNNENDQYFLRQIHVPAGLQQCSSNLNIAVANIKLKPEDMKSAKKWGRNRWKNITLDYKEILQNILRETYKYNKDCSDNTKILVMPELSLPIYWIDDIVRFSKRTQTAVVAGLQYIYDDSGRAYNYVLTVLPFEYGKRKYKNAFIYIREKNDYSPIEKVELAKSNHHCVDTHISDYQVFSWKGVNLAALVCYEFTDVIARALLKGKCDIIAAPVFNQDTTYFSNIIDTTARDLHAFIVQSNTSVFGDSRVTGPYDRDSKDVFKIKGGENDIVIVGTVDFEKYIDYQAKYYKNLNDEILSANGKSKNNTKKKKEKPDIKPLSARYNNHRTNRNNQK